MRLRGLVDHTCGTLAPRCGSQLHDLADGPATGRLGADNFELYFECPDLDSAWARVEAAALGPNRIVHPIEEQPWLQRGFRLRDPDGHLVEVGEPLPALVKRLLGQGMTLEDISTRTTIALEAVRAMAEGE